MDLQIEQRLFQPIPFTLTKNNTIQQQITIQEVIYNDHPIQIITKALNHIPKTKYNYKIPLGKTYISGYPNFIYTSVTYVKLSI